MLQWQFFPRVVTDAWPPQVLGFRGAFFTVAGFCQNFSLLAPRRADSLGKQLALVSRDLSQGSLLDIRGFFFQTLCDRGKTYTLCVVVEPEVMMMFIDRL